ncbi:hypothetical protein J4558_19815 [Leptolyngbya sp. 15MV]|nr:hypothetical protein J4558_19815 [Leptolyngbya sp. 15MV]
MYRILVAFWGAVRDVFPEAWGLPPTASRLMHAAGIEAMGTLMDRIMSRSGGNADPRRAAQEALARIAPHCRWTSGRWPDIGKEWNEIQAVHRDIRLLADLLVRLDHTNTFARVA